MRVSCPLIFIITISKFFLYFFILAHLRYEVREKSFHVKLGDHSSRFFFLISRQFVQPRTLDACVTKGSRLSRVHLGSRRVEKRNAYREMNEERREKERRKAVKYKVLLLTYGKREEKKQATPPTLFVLEILCFMKLTDLG